MQALKDSLKVAETRARSLKTKKAQAKAWEAYREIKREIFRLLCDERNKFARHSVKGIVKTFSAGNDHFLVETPYGSMWVSPTGDALTKSWYAHTCCIEYTVGQEIIIEIEIDLADDGMRLGSFPKRIHGGTVNESQYGELCKKGNLAFFKYPEGHMSGLFA